MASCMNLIDFASDRSPWKELFGATIAVFFFPFACFVNSGVLSLALLESGVFLFGFLAHLLFVDADAEMIF